MLLNTITLLLSLWPFYAVSPFIIQSKGNTGTKSWQLHESVDESAQTNVKQKSLCKIVRPVNEFSRTMQTDKVILTKREYTMKISATTEEMNNLAKRFSLPNITALHADLIITRAVDRTDTSSALSKREESSLSSCIQVEGSVQSTCVQTCVRTNENFSVDQEFHLFTLVRPCTSVRYQDTNTRLETTMSSYQHKKKNKTRQKQQSIMQQDLKLIQSGRLTGNRIYDDDDDNYANEDIIEDEAILGENGLLDLGELVAQMFRVKLDPYPKKQGTKPVTYTITG